ncbi:hypothetical protein ID866_2607 [Astraeus odoratus]|nr:hypothetical protein ID866_2607 [Astraeus odoratus]
MPLVVPALRLLIVFLNVYETFKTLKFPPPKRGGQPSARALTQRKRDLKGCLCCYAAYERTFDRIFGFLVPFHSEMKSVLLLFLLVTRAKGAEPLYLHVIRPFIKPYSIIVDPSLEIAREIGDFLFALLQVPMDYIQSLVPHTGELTAASSDSSSCIHTSSRESPSFTRTNSNMSVPALVKPYRAVLPPHVPQVKRATTMRSVSDTTRRSSSRQSYVDVAPGRRSVRERHSKYSSTTTLPRYSPHLAPQEPPTYSQTLPRNGNHQIWYPPVSAYGSHYPDHPTDSDLGIISPSTPGLARTVSYHSSHSVREYQSEEWRSYPAFPSAYPPTPVPALENLPSPVARSKSDSYYPSIPEDPSSLPGFHVSLELQSEQKHSSSVRSSSDVCGDLSGVHTQPVNVEPPSDSGGDSGDDSSQAGLSEHSHMGDDSDVDFDRTLRTPYRFTHSNGMDPTPSSSSVSLASRSTTLTTADNASSIARTSSESLYTSDSSVGKRNGSRSRNATLRGRPGGVRLHHDPLQSSADETADEDSEDSADSGIGVKPHKVLEPVKRTSHLRPVVRVAGDTRKTLVSARTAPTRAKTVTATSNTRSSGVSTIRGPRGTAGQRRGQQRETAFGTIKATASSQTRTVRGKPM